MLLGSHTLVVALQRQLLWVCTAVFLCCNGFSLIYRALYFGYRASSVSGRSFCPYGSNQPDNHKLYKAEVCKSTVSQNSN